MRRIQLSFKRNHDDSYEITLEKGILKRIASDLRMKRFASDYVVISDTNVSKLYAQRLIDSLQKEGLFLGKIVVPSGEKSKSLLQFESCLKKMTQLGANRETGIIALGGGVVGDLAGFVAASYMRGVPLIQIPTSLLAMVDSSVGGKVGIDLSSGKNLVGAFWQPKRVYIDADVLSTLPIKQWKAGLGEAVKYGAIQDRQLWEFFEHHIGIWNKETNDFLPSDWKIVEEMIEKCIHIKATVVMKDEKEGNLRQILNYGHTFGHVIELMSNYKVLHGEAVASGMRMAADLAVKLRIMTEGEHQKQNYLLDQLHIGKSKTKGLIRDFIKHMKKDKKAKGDLRVVLVSRLGRTYQHLGSFGIKVDETLLSEVLKSSGMIDDKPVVKPKRKTSLLSPPVSSVSSWGNSSSSSSSYTSSLNSSPSSYSSYSSSSPETDLQKRLREMRERRAQRDSESESSGGLGGGGFLPG